MSIVIHGMELPKDGVKHLCVYPDGTIFDTMEFQGPLAKAIELPPHGDLIDREKIPFVEAEYACDDYAFRYDINEMTPVIPAEEE